MSVNWLARLLAGCCLVAAALPVQSAHAQTDSERAAARAAAEAGDKAFKQGQYREAARLFEKAEAIMHAPTLLLHLARSYVKLGRFVEAREAYIKITRETLPDDAPPAYLNAQKSAEAELEQVSAKLAELTIVVTGAPDDQVQLSVDAKSVSNAIVGVPYPMDPGKHRIEANAKGYAPAGAEVVLAERDRSSVTLVLEPSPHASVAGASGQHARATQQASPAPTKTSGAPPTEPTDGATGMRVGGFIGLGVAVVGATLGTVFLVQQRQTSSEADTLYNNCLASERTDCNQDPDQVAIDQEAADQKTAMAVSYSVGGAGLVAGITLLLLSGDDDGERASVHPYFSGTSAGLVGKF